MDFIQQAIPVIIFGAFGGILNALLARESFSLSPPQRVLLPDNRSSWDIGFLGNVLFGIAAAFIIWAFELSNPEPRRPCATALLSGAAGSRLVLDQLEKQKLISSVKALATATSVTAEQALSNPGCQNQNREVTYIMQKEETPGPTPKLIRTIKDLSERIKSASSSSEIVELSRKLEEATEHLENHLSR